MFRHVVASVHIPIPKPTAIIKRQLSKKKHIPKAIREQTWLRYNGENYKAKCTVTWCTNIITPFTFEVGHNIPESKGGPTEIGNLRPICPNCNRSMGTNTIDEFSKLSSPPPLLPPRPIAEESSISILAGWRCWFRRKSAAAAAAGAQP
jgi:5-methylcytosine-specific restriction endonuclease McrA